MDDDYVRRAKEGEGDPPVKVTTPTPEREVMEEVRPTGRGFVEDPAESVDKLEESD